MWTVYDWVPWTDENRLKISKENNYNEFVIDMVSRTHELEVLLGKAYKKNQLEAVSHAVMMALSKVEDDFKLGKIDYEPKLVHDIKPR